MVVRLIDAVEWCQASGRLLASLAQDRRVYYIAANLPKNKTRLNFRPAGCVAMPARGGWQNGS